MDFVAQHMKHAKTIIIASINAPAPTDIATIAPNDKAASPGLVVGVLDTLGGIVVELSMKQNIQYNYNPYSY